jgi:hypothetical protein
MGDRVFVLIDSGTWRPRCPLLFKKDKPFVPFLGTFFWLKCNCTYTYILQDYATFKLHIREFFVIFLQNC